MRWTDIWAALKEAFTEWSNDNVPRLGASLAFYTMLSLAPLLVVILAVAAVAFGKDAAQGHLFWQIRGLVGPEGARTIQGLIEGAYKPGAGALATVLGLVTLAIGASSVVVELRSALNTIWHVPPPPDSSGLSSSLISLAKERFYSFAMILGVGFLLLVSLVLNAFIAAMGKFFGGFLPAPEALLHVATALISFLVITGLFAAIYKLMPDVSLKWSDVVVGAAVTALLFTVGKQLIGLYLGKASIGSTYGAAGSLVVVLVWVYYSSQLFFLGAEFTKVYTKRFGSHLSAKLELHPPKPAALIT
jgi:membrane protein